MERLAQTAMDAVTDGRVKIIPARYAKGYLDWLERESATGRSAGSFGGDIRFRSGTARRPARRDLQKAFAGRERRRSGSATSSNGQWLHLRPGGRPAPRTPCPGTPPACRDQDVLDTWFSSALWPHSTLGWPEQTPELKYYYPTNVLITSRDIITLWVARMVLTGLHNVGECRSTTSSSIRKSSTATARGCRNRRATASIRWT